MPALIAAAFCLAAAPGARGGDESRFDPPHLGAHLGIVVEERDDGLAVSSVIPGGAAALAGIQKDDLVLRFGVWRHRETEQTLAEYLQSSHPAPTMAQVRREGSELDLIVTPDPTLVATARAVAGHLAKHPLFRRKSVRDLDRLEDELAHAVRGTATHEEAYEAINTIIDRFDISHTAILTPWVSENLFGPGEHFHLGMFVERATDGDRDRYFVRSLMYGSPAREAGVRVGDELVGVNGKGFSESPRRTLAGFEARRRMFTVQVERDEEVELDIRRRRGGRIRQLTATAERSLNAVASARHSVRVLGGKEVAPVGYIHFWNVMSGENVKVFNQALEGDLASVAALAVDLRGRGGNIAVIMALSQILADLDKPVALLVDRQTRSAKEMLAQSLKGYSHITLVGETTAGAVLPATFLKLPGGAQLMLPVSMGDSAIRMFNRGPRLEGRGAIPDVKVAMPIPYRAGRDPILRRSLALLRKQASGALLKL